MASRVDRFFLDLLWISLPLVEGSWDDFHSGVRCFRRRLGVVHRSAKVSGVMSLCGVVKDLVFVTLVTWALEFFATSKVGPMLEYVGVVGTPVWLKAHNTLVFSLKIGCL